MNSKKMIDILTRIIWNDNVGGISDACLLAFNKDGTGNCDYRELGVDENEVFEFKFEIKDNKIKFSFTEINIEFILDIKIEEREQKNIHNEVIGTEYVLIFDDHPFFLVKELSEGKQVTIGGGNVEFYQWHW